MLDSTLVPQNSISAKCLIFRVSYAEVHVVLQCVHMNDYDNEKKKMNTFRIFEKMTSQYYFILFLLLKGFHVENESVIVNEMSQWQCT